MGITFSSHDLSFTLREARKVRQWLTEAIHLKGFSAKNIHFVYCSEQFILQTNIQYLKHQYYTDVITFDYTTGKQLAGDILIAVPIVKSNAKLYAVPFRQELLRVMIHGVLHLMGYKDGTDDEKSVMTTQEDALLRLFETKFN